MIYTHIPTEESCNITIQVIKDMEKKGINTELQKYTMVQIIFNWKKMSRVEIK